MNQIKHSTIRQSILSIYTQESKHTEPSNESNSFKRSLSNKEQVNKPTESKAIEQRKREITNRDWSFFRVYAFSTQQRSVFSASMRPNDWFPARNDGPTPQDTNPRRLSSQKAKSTIGNAWTEPWAEVDFGCPLTPCGHSLRGFSGDDIKNNIF